MANWTVALDRPLSFEAPNAFAYVTYSSDDARTKAGIRTPFDTEEGLLNHLARECARLAELDDRNDELAALVASSSLSVGQLVLPDMSTKVEADAAQIAFSQKLNAAAGEKSYRDALEIDPTLADAKSALDAAQAALSDAVVAASRAKG